MRSTALIAAAVLVAAACSGSGTDEPEGLHFVDVAAEAGLDFTHGSFRWEASADPVAMMGGGLCWIDYDGDGWQDLFVVNSYAEAEWGRWTDEGGLPTSALYRNRRGEFVDVSTEAGVDLATRGNGCVAADLDGDGDTDLYITTARENVLLWNQGDGTFADGGAAAGVDAYGWHSGAAVGDVNGDGLPDLFVAGYVDLNTRDPESEGGFPSTYVGRRDLLYLNRGDGTFHEVGEPAGLDPAEHEYGLGAVLTDLDADGDLDLYVANDTNPNRLYENIPRPDDPDGLGFRFSEIAAAARVGDDNSGMGVASADFDGDGRFDLLVTNLDRQLHSVYANQGALGFADATATIGVADFGVGSTGWGASWADVDLDTDLDLIVANGAVPVVDPAADAQPLVLYGNGGDGRLTDLSTVAGLDAVGPVMGRGTAAADYDNDGDVDVAVNVIGGALVLLENRGVRGNWLLVDPGGSRPGSLVTAVLPSGRELRCEVRAGSSYLSSEDPRCHFGLGDADRVVEVRVRWPNGTETSTTDPGVNRIVTPG